MLVETFLFMNVYQKSISNCKLIYRIVFINQHLILNLFSVTLKLKVYIDFSSKIQNELNTYIMKVFCLLIPNGHVDNRNIFVGATAAIFVSVSVVQEIISTLSLRKL